MLIQNYFKGDHMEGLILKQSLVTISCHGQFSSKTYLIRRFSDLEKVPEGVKRDFAEVVFKRSLKLKVEDEI